MRLRRDSGRGYDVGVFGLTVSITPIGTHPTWFTEDLVLWSSREGGTINALMCGDRLIRDALKDVVKDD
jgi:hypothetical protein